MVTIRRLGALRKQLALLPSAGRMRDPLTGDVLWVRGHRYFWMRGWAVVVTPGPETAEARQAIQELEEGSSATAVTRQLFVVTPRNIELHEDHLELRLDAAKNLVVTPTLGGSGNNLDLLKDLKFRRRAGLSEVSISMLDDLVVKLERAELLPGAE